MGWAKNVIFLMATVAISTTQDCLSGQLMKENDFTPSVSLEKAITLRLSPQHVTEELLLQMSLETTDGEPLYGLWLDANMNTWKGDVQVTLMDMSARSNILDVVWPPLLLPLVWTTVHLRLRYKQVLQLAVLPHDVTMAPTKSSIPHFVARTPVAVSVKLRKTAITTLRLKLLTANASIEYTINCGQEYLATSFSSEFGISSSVPIWRSWVFILTGIVAILLMLMAATLVLCYIKLKALSPKSFTLTQFQSSSHSDGISPVLVSSSRGGRGPDRDRAAEEMEQTPRITVGVVSSRAPSPGHEVDENTFDYINRAFSHCVKE